jgi:signal transduction histidine kinase
MSGTDTTGKPSRARGLLTSLMRSGASVIADVPQELHEQFVDPTPQPGWRRISQMSSSGARPATDALLARATRYVVLVPLIFRVFTVPMRLLSYLAANGGNHAWPVITVTALSVLVNLASAAWVLRVPGIRGSWSRLLLLGDAVLAVALNLFVAFTVPDPQFVDAAPVTWLYLVGTVALWTLTWGMPAGFGLLLISVPMLLVERFAAGHTASDWAGGAAWAGLLLGEVAATVTATAMLLIIGLGTRLTLGLGLHRGREAEQARNRRLLHDTVLQTLEAMALPLPGGTTDLPSAQAALAELRGIARAQAIELRRSLDDEAEAGPAGLGEDLAGIAAEMAREGLRAQLVFSDVDDASLSENRRLAVRDAVREAMRNTMKHAGTAEVVLRVEQREGGIAVIARDHGDGFDTDSRPPGFGISHSISARLHEVGGSASVESKPGHGTRVTLWVPF